MISTMQIKESSEAYNRSWSVNFGINMERFCPDKVSRHKHSLLRLWKKELTKVGIVVGAGSSLDKNVSQLANLNDKAVILCTDAAYLNLIANGIYANYIISFDETFLVEDFIPSIRDSDEEILITSITNNHKALDNFQGKIYFCHNPHPRLLGGCEHRKDPQFLSPEFPPVWSSVTCVTFYAIEIGRFLGINTFGVIGNDFGWEGYKHHCDHFPIDERRYAEYTEKSLTDAYRGRFDGKIEQWKASDRKKGIYNCTEGGFWHTDSDLPLADFIERYGLNGIH